MSVFKFRNAGLSASLHIPRVKDERWQSQSQKWSSEKVKDIVGFKTFSSALT